MGESIQKEARTDQNTAHEPQNRKEELYERFRGKIAVRTLDIIIAVLFVCLAVVIVLGIIRGNGS